MTRFRTHWMPREGALAVHGMAACELLRRSLTCVLPQCFHLRPAALHRTKCQDFEVPRPDYSERGFRRPRNHRTSPLRSSYTGQASSFGPFFAALEIPPRAGSANPRCLSGNQSPFQILVQTIPAPGSAHPHRSATRQCNAVIKPSYVTLELQTLELFQRLDVPSGKP